MSNHSHQNKNNLLKGIGTLCIFIIFGYYIYQDAMNRMKLGKSLNENATPPQREFSRESSQLQCSPAIHENAADKNVTRKMQYAVSNNSNDYDTFNEHLDEYLADPEDEITYPPEIYDALIDDE
ncbi:hypothetical protein [uncultured Bacteroides sp.]|uniref:hypothetical protein n=1 Tax=uncultured Bacteroides sp. TaxID=162156 RepID=UPI00260248C4|nr:hypothetical protein [uncultured Bacteroides sp.]